MKIQYKEDPWNNKNHNVSKMLLKPMSNQFPESENSEDFCSSAELVFNLKLSFFVIDIIPLRV